MKLLDSASFIQANMVKYTVKQTSNPKGSKMKIQTFDNGDIAIEGFNRISPEGCPSQVFKHPVADIFITVQSQCLEAGEPYQVTVLNCPCQCSKLVTTTGTIEFVGDGPEPVYENLDAWLTNHLGH